VCVPCEGGPCITRTPIANSDGVSLISFSGSTDHGDVRDHGAAHSSFLRSHDVLFRIDYFVIHSFSVFCLIWSETSEKRRAALARPGTTINYSIVRIVGCLDPAGPKNRENPWRDLPYSHGKPPFPLSILSLEGAREPELEALRPRGDHTLTEH
jgi:hypothetical protein